MKAIRSLEQHVDSLLSYDFSGLDEDALMQSAALLWTIVGSGSSQRRSAEAFSYEEIHDITKIDVWFIDKLAILVEMEQALQSQPLTVELLQEAKRIEFPDNVIAQPDRQDRGGDQGYALCQWHRGSL